MFKKRLKIRKVRHYRDPAYPVMEAGEVLSTPRELHLGQVAKDLARPVMPLMLTTVMLTQKAETSEFRQDGPDVRIELKVGNDETRPSSTIRTDEKQDQKPSRVRRFSDAEIASLVQELNMREQFENAVHVKGEVAVTSNYLSLTEAQGRQILEKFFKKNGIVLREGENIKEVGLEMELDGFNPRKKIGYEFATCQGEPDLTAEEIGRLEKGVEGKHVLLVKGESCKLPNAREVVLHLQKTAEAFLEKLYANGTIEAPAEKVEEENVKPLLEQLRSSRWKEREEATERLIEMGVAVQSHVEAHLKWAREIREPEVIVRCERILKDLGD